MSDPVFICGDSHSSILSIYARETGIDFLGGPIGNGITLESDFCRLAPNGRLVLTDPEIRPRQPRFRDLPIHPGPILSTVGFNSHRAANSLSTYLADSGTALEELSDAVFRATVLAMRGGSLAFYKLLRDAGRQVYFTTSPQLTAEPGQLPVLQRFESVMIDEITAMGCVLVDVRDEIMGDGAVRDEFVRKEGARWIHGNDDWAKLVFARLAELCGTPETV